MADTNLSQTISATNDSGSVYDTNVKKLLADKQILSWILKYTVDEFKDMDILNIRSCIGDDIEVSTKYVDPGLSNLGRVQETFTEDDVPGEGSIRYDIRFTAYHKEMELRILINIDYSDFGIIPINLFYRRCLKPFKQVYRNNFLIAS